VAALRFYFGTMGSGKSTVALQIHHNLARRGLRGVLSTQLDRRGAMVSSRLGVSAEAMQVDADTDFVALATAGGRRLDYIVCDEAQFYEPDQIDQLARCVDEYGTDVYAFGLLTSFQGRLFPGTVRLLELADERIELSVEARCWCGRRATHNARIVGGTQVYEGELKAIGDTQTPSVSAQVALDGTPPVTYELLCRRHWLAGEIGPDTTPGSAGAGDAKDADER
jgi:thymidine kinase